MEQNSAPVNSHTPGTAQNKRYQKGNSALHQNFRPSVFLEHYKTQRAVLYCLRARIGRAAPEPFHETHTF
ncbi:hypothetical protein [Mycoavidus cysteinexigens]|uniref:hypothetical protein n=1 Tax=Mycoavidus cysteinexigens TaxID=1553431 RepID=UPI00047953A0|nr:hypothetical protein [Mycoavidus cysteinexigens]